MQQLAVRKTCWLFRDNRCCKEFIGMGQYVDSEQRHTERKSILKGYFLFFGKPSSTYTLFFQHSVEGKLPDSEPESLYSHKSLRYMSVDLSVVTFRFSEYLIIYAKCSFSIHVGMYRNVHVSKWTQKEMSTN